MKFNKILLTILLAGFILRVFWFKELFLYGHDQDLIGWTVRDVVENHHFRLIGQETSNLGVFIGPLFYYAIIPFYLLTGGDPLGGVILSTIVGLFSIFSFYWIFKRIWNEKIGLIGATIYAFSFLTVMTDREIVPTTPVMLWSVWFLYVLWALYKGKQRQGFLITGILLGTIWHLNLALMLLIPLLPLSLFLSRKRIEWKAVLLGLIPLVLLSIPLVFFEVRHNFSQTHALIESLTTPKTYGTAATTGSPKLDRVMQLVTKNVNRLFVGELPFIPGNAILLILIIGSFVLVSKRKLDKPIGLILGLWVILFLGFFTFNSINVSEYYLNGMNVIWIAIASVGLFELWQSEEWKHLALVMICVFIGINGVRFFTQPLNESGYIQRKAVVEFIKEDAMLHNYPCVSVSYITKPGYELGYRYFFYLAKVHVNQPKSGSPVYTIVFPHSMVDKIDKSFGALGLILPEYEKYSPESVTISCSGENANLTDPLFGFTQ
jgi:4-amino-4-deoxy-L-arabinose transferase-like glycosyltransferase